MKLVNITDRNVYNSTIGNVAPGRTTPDTYKDFCKAMQKVVDMCGNRFGIILNDSEAALLERIVSLDELGEKFDVNSIPAEVRNDPLGKKRASEMTRKSQHAAIVAEQNPRKPVGPATMEGEKVKPEMLKSGFEAILAENERIAAGKGKEHASVQEMLDPVGAHMKKNAAKDPAPAENDGTGLGDAQPVRQARDLDGDAVRSADANLPAPEVSERANAMDRQASDIARKLSTIGPEAPLDPAYKPPVDAGLEILPKPGSEPGDHADGGTHANDPAQQLKEPDNEPLAEPVNEPLAEPVNEPLAEPVNEPGEPVGGGKPAKQPKGKKSVKKGKGRKGA